MPAAEYGGRVLSKSYAEASRNASELAALITQTINEHGEEKTIGEVAAALLEALALEIGHCPLPIRRELMRRFRIHLLESLERDIEDTARMSDEIAGLIFIPGGVA
jgi:hypothetical protein